MLELKDRDGTMLLPGDSIVYYSPSYKQWLRARLVEVIWTKDDIKYKVMTDAWVDLQGTRRWGSKFVIRSLKDVRKVI